MSDPFASFRPTAERPWDRRRAAHLLRRAGFAPSEEEVRDALRDGPAATASRLTRGEQESLRALELDELGASIATREDIGALRGWWLLRMRHTARPLAARLALFWHDHFATSYVKVGSVPMMLQQLRTFERHALGRFEDLLLAVARDPAMIVWLDGGANVKGRPNENFARELLELFTLGVGHYAEADVREAARAFTGWQQRGGVARFNRLAHDDGEKTVLGQSGRFGAEDVIAIVLQQPACAEFLAEKMLREFVTPSPPEGLRSVLATKLRETGFDLAATLETLLGGEAMFDPACRRARIKSPVELTVGMARSLDLQVPANVLADAASQMGQRLFEPPSVKGWDDHRAWLNSATMLVRLSAAGRAVEKAAGFDPARFRSRHGLGEDATAIARFGEQLALDGDAPESLRERLSALTGSPDDVARQALTLLLTSPEYQMA